jgi:hypothetical protein
MVTGTDQPPRRHRVFTNRPQRITDFLREATEAAGATTRRSPASGDDDQPSTVATSSEENLSMSRREVHRSPPHSRCDAGAPPSRRVSPDDGWITRCAVKGPSDSTSDLRTRSSERNGTSLRRRRFPHAPASSSAGMNTKSRVRPAPIPTGRPPPASAGSSVA